MKKFLLIPFIALIVASCGPSEEELANAKKQFLQSFDSTMVVYEAQVNDYCKCLETGTTDECKLKHQTAHATWMSLIKQTDESYKYMVMPDESKKMRDRYSEIMDKGAYCAKEAIANTMMDANGKMFRAQSSTDNSANTDQITSSESSSKTGTASSGNNSKTTSAKKSTEKTKAAEEEHDHEEHHSDPY